MLLLLLLLLLLLFLLLLFCFFILAIIIKTTAPLRIRRPGLLHLSHCSCFIYMIKHSSLTIESFILSDYVNVSFLLLFTRKVNFITLTQDVRSAPLMFFIIHTYLLSMNSGSLDSILVNNKHITPFAIVTKHKTIV